MKSSVSIWRYVVNVKSTVKTLSIFMAFLENMNFTKTLYNSGSAVWIAKINPVLNGGPIKKQDL